MDPAFELQILASLESLHRKVDELAASRQTEEDANLTALLTAVSMELGAAEWTVSELYDTALDPAAPGAKDLLRVIIAIIGKRKTGNPRRRLGRYLQQHVGTVGQWRLELANHGGRDGNVYAVRDLSPLSRNPVANVR